MAIQRLDQAERYGTINPPYQPATFDRPAWYQQGAHYFDQHMRLIEPGVPLDPQEVAEDESSAKAEVDAEALAREEAETWAHRREEHPALQCAPGSGEGGPRPHVPALPGAGRREAAPAGEARPESQGAADQGGRMPAVMPNVEAILRSPAFGGAAAPPVARPAAAASAHPTRPVAFEGTPAAAPSAPVPPAQPAGLAGILAALTQRGAPPATPAPVRPVAAVPAPPRPLRALARKLITAALAENEERLLWFAKADLDLLGFDEAALDKLLDSLDLFAADNVDGNGGTLIARSQDILKERLQPQPGEGIPVYGVIQHARQEGRI